jgi:hypothetical protein
MERNENGDNSEDEIYKEFIECEEIKMLRKDF